MSALDYRVYAMTAESWCVEGPGIREPFVTRGPLAREMAVLIANSMQAAYEAGMREAQNILGEFGRPK